MCDVTTCHHECVKNIREVYKNVNKMCDVSDELLYNGVLPLLTRHSLQLVIVKLCAIVPRAGEMLNTPPHPASSSIWRMFLLFSCTCFLAHQTLFGACFSCLLAHVFWHNTVLHVVQQKNMSTFFELLELFCCRPVDSKSEVSRHKTWYYPLA
jgi:hypothetical protein